MKILIALLAFLICCIALSACDKKTCYDCQVNSGGQLKKEKVCTDGDPQDELPHQDANGMLVWDCKKR